MEMCLLENWEEGGRGPGRLRIRIQALVLVAGRAPGPLDTGAWAN